MKARTGFAHGAVRSGLRAPLRIGAHLANNHPVLVLQNTAGRLSKVEGAVPHDQFRFFNQPKWMCWRTWTFRYLGELP